MDNTNVGGPHAATIVDTNDPRFYVFVTDRMDPPPHLLLQLEAKSERRQFTVVSEKGRKGYAPLAKQNVKLDYRILERLKVQVNRGRMMFVNYLELRPRQVLRTGEYAVVGDSFQDIATFRVP